MPTMLTPHFSLEELTASQTAARLGLDNTPDEAALANLGRLATALEDVRILLGDRPVLISSGYRSPAVNAAVGGASSSAHTKGLAADFTCPGFGSPLAVCRALEPHFARLGADQTIHEYGAWVHLAVAAADAVPRLMALTIDGAGTRYGFA